MRIGTKSVLFGAHAFYLHPWFVARAWWQLYGFPWDPRLWVAFFVHDLGYFGKPNMDGPEGEQHPLLGAKIMHRLFGQEWGEFCMYHSRYLAKQHGRHYSRLCVADKLAIALTPAWLYLPLVKLTGEVHEYMAAVKHRREMGDSPTPEIWFAGVRDYMRRWVAEHSDGREDTWTTTDREPGEDGVWK